MDFEHAAKIKEQYTDKYVVVDGDRPELARFDGVVGLVRTVNMSGRALVEFLDYHLNIGWYDIEIDYLKVVDRPLPKEEKPAAKAKPAAKKAPPAKAAAVGEKKLSALELARMQGAAKTPATAVETKAPSGKKSVAEIMAAARAPKGSSTPAPAAAATKGAPAKVDRSKMSVADMIAAARAEKSDGTAPPPSAEEAVATKEPAAAKAAPAKVDRSKMSVADMIAAARAEKSDGAAPPPAAETPAATEEPAAETAAVEEPAAEESPPPSKAPAAGKVDRSTMSVDDMVAWCRQHDGQ